MPKIVKGYLTADGKFFDQKDEATTFEAIATLKKETGKFVANAGITATSSTHMVLVRDMVANADTLAPALRAMAKFVKRNRKEKEAVTAQKTDMDKLSGDTTNAIARIVQKHFP